MRKNSNVLLLLGVSRVSVPRSVRERRVIVGVRGDGDMLIDGGESDLVGE